MQLSQFESVIDYKFNNKKLLKEALTHRSYINEMAGSGASHNERLEFLGDAVLELAVTEELFNRYPNRAEGELTPIRSALVNYQMLSLVARGINMEDFILLSRGEAKDTGRARDVILANAIEAVIGAIHLDGGFSSAKVFINRFVMIQLEDVMRKELFRDAKSFLQEKVQEKFKVTPKYKVIKETGPDHEKIFEVGVYYGEEFIAKGSGASKQDAEVEAAKRALEALK